ncbi:MAG: hypothetical protein ACE5K0_11600 [Candidatus Methanofastidiosia archaeon]
MKDGKTTTYIYSGIKVIYGKVLETGVETKYIGSIAKIENGVTTYYHVDHLGSTRQVTDENGNALFTDYLIYKPFGEIYTGNAGDERYLFNGFGGFKHL